VRVVVESGPGASYSYDLPEENCPESFRAMLPAAGSGDREVA
jgi:hypothetical protein